MSIEVRDVSKNFGSFAALRDINLVVPDGELVALLGPSGSGKTTLLRLLAGLEAPDKGQVLFNGHDITRHQPRERNVGFVFQHYALFAHMSVFENIAFGLRVRRVKNAEVKQRVDELLRLIQLEGFGKRYPSQLSGGQRQRVALARSLAARPEVLLLDEPFGALDAKVRQDLRRWLRGLHDEIHTTSVFVTHDQEEAFEVADRVVIVNEGRIEQVGTPDEVFSHPANAFVIDFLGRVNIFHGRVENGRVAAGGFEVAHPESVDAASQTATVYVRAHEWDIVRERAELNGRGEGALRARVNRINRVGATVKLDLVPEDPSDATRQPFDAEIDDRRFAELGLLPQEIIYAAPRQARVFLNN